MQNVRDVHAAIRPDLERLRLADPVREDLPAAVRSDLPEVTSIAGREAARRKDAARVSHVSDPGVAIDSREAQGPRVEPASRRTAVSNL